MGPLAGLRIVEFAGIGPGPMAAMLFADLGARVIRVDRVSASDLGIAVPTRFELLTRSRPSVAVDLKHPDGIALAIDLVANADGLIEGFRPGTMERLGLGPDILLTRNPRLVYGRMTGWGQTGPLAHAAGHDLNYLALAGGLHAIGRAGAKPTPPLNLAADFGGGALYLAFGMACAMLEAQRSGKGQVVDAAMTEGAASLMTLFYGLYAAGRHNLERGTNLLDSGSAIYEVYECADGRFISVAAIEAKFRKVLFDRLGLPFTTDDGPELRGWFKAPRTLPLVLSLIRDKKLSPKSDPTNVYLELLSRQFGDGIVEIQNEADHAYAAGYTSTRAKRTWEEHMRLLESLGFIKIKGIGPSPYKYVLIVHPSTAIHELEQKGLVQKEWMDVYRDRCAITKELSYEDRQAARKRANVRPIAVG